MPPLKLVDIGINLTDPVFRGVYRSKRLHADDFAQVLQRARAAGVQTMMVTGTNLKEARQALEMAKAHEGLYATVGCHPTQCKKFAEQGDRYFDELLDLAMEGKRCGKVVAIGECGLDYDRLSFCPRDIQLQYFERQFALAEQTKLPMFLHSRAAFDENGQSDMLRLLKAHRSAFSTGVVHSFDGTVEEMQSLIDIGMYIGINGCSLKQEQGIEVLRRVPLDRLMIETASVQLFATGLDQPLVQDAQYPFPQYFFADVQDSNSGEAPSKKGKQAGGGPTNMVSKPERWREGVMPLAPICPFGITLEMPGSSAAALLATYLRSLCVDYLTATRAMSSAPPPPPPHSLSADSGCSDCCCCSADEYTCSLGSASSASDWWVSTQRTDGTSKFYLLKPYV
ncbi:hypothetical protein RI367_004180 [Sorochytrium milnesiophthora]